MLYQVVESVEYIMWAIEAFCKEAGELLDGVYIVSKFDDGWSLIGLVKIRYTIYEVIVG